MRLIDVIKHVLHKVLLLWNKAKEAPLFTFKRDLIFTFPGYDVLLFGYEVMLVLQPLGKWKLIAYLAEGS